MVAVAAAVMVVAVVGGFVINLKASVITLSDIQILLLYGISVTGEILLSLLPGQEKKKASCMYVKYAKYDSWSHYQYGR